MGKEGEVAAVLAGDYKYNDFPCFHHSTSPMNPHLWGQGFPAHVPDPSKRRCWTSGSGRGNRAPTRCTARPHIGAWFPLRASPMYTGPGTIVAPASCSAAISLTASAPNPLAR